MSPGSKVVLPLALLFTVCLVGEGGAFAKRSAKRMKDPAYQKQIKEAREKRIKRRMEQRPRVYGKSANPMRRPGAGGGKAAEKTKLGASSGSTAGKAPLHEGNRQSAVKASAASRPTSWAEQRESFIAGLRARSNGQRWHEYGLRTLRSPTDIATFVRAYREANPARAARVIRFAVRNGIVAKDSGTYWEAALKAQESADRKAR